MIYKILPVLALLFVPYTPNQIQNERKLLATHTRTVSTAERIYNSLDASKFSLPSAVCFTKALEGFYQLKEKGLVKKDILTVVDFSLSSNKKRLWVIDLASNTILFQSLVAHGRNTGDEFAKAFSNRAESNQSSLGFYSTGETYIGKHGFSLKLDGLEKGVNHNARARAVVIHGADYVSEKFIRNHNRLGRSQGCPALPNALSKDIINVIKDKSCLYIYHPSRTKTSVLFS